MPHHFFSFSLCLSCYAHASCSDITYLIFLLVPYFFNPLVCSCSFLISMLKLFSQLSNGSLFSKPMAFFLFSFFLTCLQEALSNSHPWNSCLNFYNLILFLILFPLLYFSFLYQILSPPTPNSHLIKTLENLCSQNNRKFGFYFFFPLTKSVYYQVTMVSSSSLIILMTIFRSLF